VAFLASCPDCGQFQVCVLSQEAQPRLRCARCRAVYPSVLVGKELELATTLVEGDFEPSGGTATLVVVQNLPSVYPKQRRKRRKARRKVAAPVVAESRAAPVVYLVAEPAIGALLEPVIEPLPEPIAESLPQLVVEPPAPIIPAKPAHVPQRPKPVRRPAEDDEPEYGRLQLNAAAVLTLFLVGGAIGCASIESVTGLVRPLAGVSVALGLVAAVTSGLAGRRLLLPVALVVVATAVFITSFAAPELLGPTYAASRLKPGEDDIQVIPHPQYVRDTRLRSAEWVDASRASVRQGRFRVEVLHARVGPGWLAGQPSVSKQYLLVHIRLHRHKTPAEMEAGAFAPPVAWPANIRATLWDATGNQYDQQQVEAPRTAGPGHSSSLGAIVDETDEVLAFDIPIGSIKSLKLELPAAAWGGKGAIKFVIPGSMIKR
jgi:hypothetical protein